MVNLLRFFYLFIYLFIKVSFIDSAHSHYVDQSSVQSLSQNICVFSNFLNCGREPDARSSFGNPFHRWGASKPNAPSPTFFWAMGWCNVNALAPRRQLFKPRGANSLPGTLEPSHEELCK